jgi:RND family efflux transporter MFP subunit
MSAINSGISPRFWRWLPLLVLGVLVQGGAVRAAPAQISAGPVQVKVFTVGGDAASTTPGFSGRVEAGDSAQLSFRVAGQIAAMHVLMGASVSKGDVLAQLKPTDYQLKLQASQAEYELARLAAERADTLFQRRLVSEDQQETAQANLAISDARLEQAREQLSYTRLVAPFDGSIAFTYAMPSEVVSPQQPILTLQDTSKVDIRFNLPQHYQALLQGQTPATFQLVFDLQPGKLVDAVLKDIQLRPDPDTNSYPITLTAPEPEDFSPRPGMSARVFIRHPGMSRSEWRIPSEALFDRDGGRAHVWLIDPAASSIRKTPILLDEAGLLLEGLKPGDSIVAAGAARLVEGQVVQRWEREGGL